MSRECEDGISFGSKPERDRYRELRARLLAGEIRNLVAHPVYELMADAIDRWCRKIPKIEYTADFEYEELAPDGSWDLVTEEVKGIRKYRWVRGPKGKPVKKKSWDGYRGRDYVLRVNLFRRRFRDRDFREIRMEAVK